MADTEEPDILVRRLHSLLVSHGLTIKEMAERCGVPKSSLEGYMRLKGAKRPGVDALVAIADGMGVSIDWLVGRTDAWQPSEEDRQRYALALFDTVVELLREIDQAQSESASPVVANGMIGGRSLENFAARTMLRFATVNDLFPSEAYDNFRAFDAILQRATDRKPETD
ncbi:MAG: helix-turn-helix domain-containing protein [Rhodovulum sp.]